jgi:hypothetical protein
MGATVTGRNAVLFLGTAAPPTKGINVWGVSDLSVTFDRGSVEQELIGQPGNYFDQGSLSIEGSITNCRFAASGNADALLNIIDSDTYPNLRISGAIGSDNGLTFYFRSAQVTSYEVAIGDGDTISEASIDFQVLNPADCSYNLGHIVC